MHGTVEVDETYLGGKSRFMHKSKRERVITKPGMADKLPVLGMLERGTKKRKSKVIAWSSARLLAVPKSEIVPKPKYRQDF